VQPNELYQYHLPPCNTVSASNTYESKLIIIASCQTSIISVAVTPFGRIACHGGHIKH
jgi:hypothetical protein